MYHDHRHTMTPDCPVPIYDQRQGAKEPLNLEVDLPKEQDVAAILFGPSPVHIEEHIEYDLLELALLDEIAY